MKVKSKAKMGLRGTLRIYKRDVKTQHKEAVFVKENLIVNAAKTRILSTVFSPTFTPDPVVALGVGTGGTIDPDGLYPKQELPTQTSLNTQILSVTVSYTVAGDGLSVVFLADMDESEGNGSLISEAGLLTNSGALFNVKNFPGIPKTAGFSIHFEWTIEIL